MSVFDPVSGQGLSDIGQTNLLAAPGAPNAGAADALANIARAAYEAMKVQLVDVPTAAATKERAAIEAANSAVSAAKSRADSTGYYEDVTGFNYNPNDNTMTPIFSGKPILTTAQQKQNADATGLYQSNAPVDPAVIAAGGTAGVMDTGLGQVMPDLATTTLASQAQNAALTGQIPTWQTDSGNLTVQQMRQALDQSQVAGNTANFSDAQIPLIYAHYTGQFTPTQTDTEATREFKTNTGLSVLKLLQAAQSNPFQQEAIARGANAMGIPNSLAALTGMIPHMPSVSGTTGTPQTAGLDWLMNAVNGGASGGSVSNAAASGGGVVGGPSGGVQSPLSTALAAGSAGAAAGAGINSDATIASLQNTPVNKWSPQDYYKIKASNPDFLNSAIQAAGLNATDVENTMSNLLPQFQTNKFGSVNVGGSIANAQSGA